MSRPPCLPSLAVALALTSSASLAQSVPAVEAVRSSAGFRDAAQKNFNAYESSLSTHCPAVEAAWDRAADKLYGQPTLSADGGLVNATWIETVPGRACGHERRYRVLVAIRAGHASVAPLIPGESIASPQLEMDAKAPVIAAAREFAPRGEICQTADILDTSLVQAPTQSRQPWDEMWLVQACGKRLQVPIRFVPDAVGEGTSIRIESKAVTVAP